MRVDAEREIAQDLGAQPVAQADVLESDHSPLRQYRRAGTTAGAARPRIRPWIVVEPA
jgi:hypothetical protein